MPPAPISELLPEIRVFPPPAAFAAAANVHAEEYERAAADPVAWWEQQAGRLEWTEPWHTAHRFVPALREDGTLQPPEIAWFEGGQLNVAATASTGTSPPAWASASRSTSRANRATGAASRTPSCSGRWRGPRTRSRRSVCAPATASSSTCPCCSRP